MVAPGMQSCAEKEELDASVFPSAVQLARQLDARALVVRHPAQRALADLVVDGPPVVRIDERQVPELGALVEIRNARRGDLQHYLRERIVHADFGDSPLELEEVPPEA